MKEPVHKQIGPFTVVPLNRRSANSLAIGPHGMEPVKKGEMTKTHTHQFLSLYVAVGLALISGGKTYSLPPHALVIVPQGVAHSWSPTKKVGRVGSIDQRHKKQDLLVA